MVFSDAEGLEPHQKAKLSEIYSNVYQQSMSIRREIGKSKSLLFATLASDNYKAIDVENLKTKIVDLDQQRLNIMFKALDDVQAVVGTGIGKSHIYKHFQEHEYPQHVPY
jgi:hypothetical protein